MSLLKLALTHPRQISVFLLLLLLLKFVFEQVLGTMPEGFYMCWESNSGPHMYVASTILTEPSANLHIYKMPGFLSLKVILSSCAFI